MLPQKKRINSKAKGSRFETSMCKELSLWFSGGKYDDLFCKTPGSGSRATVRGKKGIQTKYGHGDVMAAPLDQEYLETLDLPCDPAKLLNTVAISLKCGYSDVSYQDLFDSPNPTKTKFFEFIQEGARMAQALRDSNSWHETTAVKFLLIFRRNRRLPVVLIGDSKMCLKDGGINLLRIQEYLTIYSWNRFLVLNPTYFFVL